MQIVTRAQMQQIEQNALDYDLTFYRLMENAGSAAAAFIRRTFQVQGLNCMIFCSKGNNGGDGLVVARKLAEDGANVVIVMLDGIPRSEEASIMYQTVQMMELPMVDFSSSAKKVQDFLTQTDIVVDAICGTGFAGDLRDNHRMACQAINNSIAAVISLDVPTGVECDTGRADKDAIRADFTVAFDSGKPAHVAPEAQALCGTVEVVDIGIPQEAHDGVVPNFDALDGGNEDETVVEAAYDPISEPVQEIPFYPLEEETACTVAPDPALSTGPAPVLTHPLPEEPPQQVATAEESTALEENSEAAAPPEEFPEDSDSNIIRTEWVIEQLPLRPADSHKGDFGRLLNISGCQNYRGAATLSTLAALRCGAGLVTLASVYDVCASTAAHILESTYFPLPQDSVGGIDFEGAVPLLETALTQASALLIGCGLGNTSHTRQLLAFILEQATCPLVVDADGINALAGNIHVLHRASAPVILTPHQGEMARLCGVSSQEIGGDREGFALRFARENNVVLVLKGAHTVIASPNGKLLKNHTGNPGLAKGGSGDILSGMTAALLAQKLPAFTAAACAVHLHGLAADRTAARRSQYAMLPSELLEDLTGILLEHGR